MCVEPLKRDGYLLGRGDGSCGLCIRLPICSGKKSSFQTLADACWKNSNCKLFMALEIASGLSVSRSV